MFHMSGGSLLGCKLCLHEYKWKLHVSKSLSLTFEVMRGEHFCEEGRVSEGAKLSKLGRVSHTNILTKTIKMSLHLYLLFPDATLFLAPIEFTPPF